LRDDKHAQSEIQEFAQAMKVIGEELFPFTFEAYQKYKFTTTETPPAQ